MSHVGVSILGATGSIGTSALAVLDQHGERFAIVALTAHRNRNALESLARQHRPALAVLANGADAGGAVRVDGVRWATGREALIEAATHPDADVVLNALVGAAGLESTLAALRAGKRVALANKESLVCAGPLVLEAAEAGGGELLPVDSEHSAIFQCLEGCRGEGSTVRKLVLTASGGPFRTLSEDELGAVTRHDALQHPTWNMGAKITVDSASLANKALEVIEAHHLFGVGYDDIEAVVHPQSIIHSMVEFVDGSVLAQMGFPTMEIPIMYALSYPNRLAYESRSFDPLQAGDLTFERLRHEVFRTFALGVMAGRTGGTAPAVFNAANEIAVAAFLKDRLSFPGIPAVIEDALERADGRPLSQIDDVLAADARARRVAENFVRTHAP